MIKQLTFSAVTGGALVLAYAAWSKWRGAGDGASTLSSRGARSSSEPPLSEAMTEAAPLAVTSVPAEPRGAGTMLPLAEPESIDVVLDDLWSADETAPSSREQLLDFSSELEDDEDDCSVAPEGLGVRWLTRATEALSPFHRELTLREQAEAALLEEREPESLRNASPEDEGKLDYQRQG